MKERQWEMFNFMKEWNERHRGGREYLEDILNFRERRVDYITEGEVLNLLLLLM